MKILERVIVTNLHTSTNPAKKGEGKYVMRIKISFF